MYPAYHFQRNKRLKTLRDLTTTQWEFLYTNIDDISDKNLRQLLDKDINMLHFVINFVTSMNVDDFNNVGALLKAAAQERGYKASELMKLLRLVLYRQLVSVLCSAVTDSWSIFHDVATTMNYR